MEEILPRNALPLKALMERELCSIRCKPLRRLSSRKGSSCLDFAALGGVRSLVGSWAVKASESIQEIAMNRLKPVQGRPGEDCLLCADSVLSFKSYL